MTKQSIDTLEVELQKGGILEYQKTGIYPEYLIVKSKKWGRRWRKSISGDKKEGVLCVNRKPVYIYRVTDGDILIFDNDRNPVEIELYSITMND